MYVKVRVQPGMRKEKVDREKNGTFAIQTREPAERNLANARVRTLLAREYGVTEGAVRLVSGHRSPVKVFDIEL